MNDPWDVKSVRQAGFYVSLMKINGTPLLPPVLSQECRKEMQYYKLLAQEVEKRISLLNTFIDDSDSSSSLDKREKFAIQYDQKDSDKSLIPNFSSDFDVKVEKVKAIHLDQDILPSSITDQIAKPGTNDNDFDNITSNVTIINNPETTHSCVSPKVLIDLSVTINDSNNKSLKESSVQMRTTHGFNFTDKDMNTHKDRNQYVSTSSNEECLVNNTKNASFVEATSKINNVLDKSTLVVNCEESCYPESIAKQDGPSSLSSKSFTGSLNDIYTESAKEIQSPRLIRQRSYTVLEPSPQLIAHLEVQSLSKGVDVTSISMSESCSNLNSAMKKRRSWDLETAKVKWSSMAMELNQKKIHNTARHKSKEAKSTTKQTVNQHTTKNVIHNKGKEFSANQKIFSTKLDQSLAKSPMKNNLMLMSNNNNVQHAKEGSPYKISTRSYKSPKRDEQNLFYKEDSQEKTLSLQSTTPLLKSSTDDPATRVRELYEKVQRQQSMQIAKLMEKQKREQNLLHQMFEEQNTILYKQLKSICPKEPIEAKEAWMEKSQHDVNQTPVSLSQLINHKPSQSDELDMSATLTLTNNYPGQGETNSTKSKNGSNNFKKSFSKVKPKTVTHIEASQHFTSNASDAMKVNSFPSKQSHSDMNRYSSASEREYEDVILTDRTNDTMADLNFTLTSDDSDPFVSNDTCVLNDATSAKDWSIYNTNCNVDLPADNSFYSQGTKKNNRKTVRQLFANPSPKEREAATRIVAYAKGYLVRRLMLTERVQSTVQTIRDALVCALQLHTDQAGIRGADIDLHRRLIQQITAACYNLHETFVLSSPAERCAIISLDRARKHALANRPPRTNSARTPDIMSESHSCVFPARVRTSSERAMTQSNYENFSHNKHSSTSRARQLTKNVDLRRRPWR